MASPLQINSRKIAALTRARRAWQTALALLVLVVCWLAFNPHPPHQVDLGWDKLNHASAFASLAVAACFGFPGPGRRVILVMLGLLAFGGLIETVQSQIPGRDAEWGDLLADSIGIAIGAAIALGALRWARY